MRKNTRKAFTILELLVVVAIIAILAIIAIPNFIGRIEQAKDSRELAEIDAVSKAVSTYYADKGVYPTIQGQETSTPQTQPVLGSPHNLDFALLVPNYLDSLPHFSYWWVDYQGKIYHTEKTVGTVSGGVFTPIAGYTYTLNKQDGSKVTITGPTTLVAGEYVTCKDDKLRDLPAVSSVFLNVREHPEAGVVAETPVVPSFETQTFTYTGAVQTVTLPPGTYKLSCWGAEGGTYSNLGGKGGYTSDIYTVTASTQLYVYVGGKGSNVKGGPGGWNGGGTSTAGGGGGASDIRTSTDPSTRLIVAGGGGGGSMGNSSVGAGSGIGGAGAGGTVQGGVAGLLTSGFYSYGGLNGVGGTAQLGNGSSYQGKSGTATNGGGSPTDTSWDGSGGGGGGYGGGASGYCNGGSGAGGGGKWINAGTAVYSSGVRVGNGEVKIEAITP